MDQASKNIYYDLPTEVIERSGALIGLSIDLNSDNKSCKEFIEDLVPPNDKSEVKDEVSIFQIIIIYTFCLT